MIEAIITRPEVPILHVAHEVLREERVALPEAIGDVDAAAQALLLRPWEPVDRAADGGAIDIEAEHEIRGEAGREAGEVVAALRAHEVRDDVAARPIAAEELVVIIGHTRSPRVLDPGLQPVLPEEPNPVRARNGAHGAA